MAHAAARCRATRRLSMARVYAQSGRGSGGYAGKLFKSVALLKDGEGEPTDRSQAGNCLGNTQPTTPIRRSWK
jgi:hypothetical protein